jgi:hypothetical protein
MPDFHNVTTWICSSNKAWETTIKGSKGDHYLVTYGPMPPSHPVQHDWACTCPAARFSPPGRYCKHVLAVIPQRCAWNAELEPTAQALALDGEHVCPMCHGPVEPIVVAV